MNKSSIGEPLSRNVGPTPPPRNAAAQHGAAPGIDPEQLVPVAVVSREGQLAADTRFIPVRAGNTFRLSQEDVLAFPEVYRRFKPKPADGRDTFRVERISPHGQRTIVYGVKRFNTGDNVVVTMHVQEPGRSGSDLPLSVQRETGWTGSPAELPRPLGDTTGTLSDRVRPGRAQPAAGNPGAVPAERNPAAIRADAVVKESLPTAPAERLAEADEALAQAARCRLQRGRSFPRENRKAPGQAPP